MKSVTRFAIAEDQEIVRKGVIDMILSFGGYKMDIEAGNGKELFDKLSGAEMLPDIVVMDISMPVWNGYETLDAIKKKWPGLSLILTIHRHELAIIQMIRSGANGFLFKNSPPKELQNALQSILDTGMYFSEIASSNLYHLLQQSNLMPFLSHKEIQLLKYSPTNLTYKEIAEKMGISSLSVAGYRNTLFGKLGVNSRAGLIVCAIQMGLIYVD